MIHIQTLSSLLGIKSWVKQAKNYLVILLNESLKRIDPEDSALLKESKISSHVWHENVDIFKAVSVENKGVIGIISELLTGFHNYLMNIFKLTPWFSFSLAWRYFYRIKGVS